MKHKTTGTGHTEKNEVIRPEDIHLEEKSPKKAETKPKTTVTEAAKSKTEKTKSHQAITVPRPSTGKQNIQPRRTAGCFGCCATPVKLPEKELANSNAQ